MKVAYFDCFSGVSGDMTLGALVDAGLALSVLREELSKLPVEHYRLEAETVKRNGLRGTKVHVIIDEAQQPTRKYTDIVEMITASGLGPEVAQQALDIFRRLGEVEAHLHHEPIEAIHFHEVGAVDSIVDVVGSVIGLHALGVHAVLASPINVGHGTVRTAHGLLPVPAPATLELVKGCPTYAGEVRMEMTTPTGAAIVTTLARRFGPLPHIRVEQVGYGAGNRDLPGQPNLLRVILGEVEAQLLEGGSHGHGHPHGHPHHEPHDHEHPHHH
jgi:uncharacterized protein (TIGR00299 family) protein